MFEAFPTEYAEVYGVPFSFIPCSGSTTEPKPQIPTTRVHALPERKESEITFPRLMGYRYELPSEKLSITFTKESRMTLSTADLPTKTENAPIVGQSTIHTLDELKARRVQEVCFLLAKLTLEKYFRADGEKQTDRSQKHHFDSEVQSWLFPQLLEITREWFSQCVICKDNTFPQLLLLMEFAHDAADRIYHSIVRSTEGEKTLLPILKPYDTIGSTSYVDFDTIRPVYITNADKCHVTHVVADTTSWEQKLAQALEDMGDVICCYVKNDHLGFTVPYTINGEEKQYVPDFIVRLDDGHGKDNPLNLVLEVTGEAKKEKQAKVSTAKSLWVPAVNNHGEFGRWAFLEITDPWNAGNEIKAVILSPEK
jgi:type III restriction enzyme